MRPVPHHQAAGRVVDRHGREAPALPQLGHPLIAGVALGDVGRGGQRLGGGLAGDEQILQLPVQHLGDFGLAPLPVSLEITGDEVEAVVRNEAGDHGRHQEQKTGHAGPVPAFGRKQGTDDGSRGGHEPPGVGLSGPRGEQREGQPRKQPGLACHEGRRGRG